jgi:predicted nucleic acid-binding protein
MANKVFLDTNGWLALLHSKDVNHERANQTWLEIGLKRRRIVLTDWIIAETGNGLARTRIRRLFGAAAERIWRSPHVDVITIDRPLMKRAIARYRHYDDKTWGLVDCASFIVMEDRGITEAFTSDRDFEQAGFVRLLAD